MNGPTRRILANATANHEMVTVWYNKPGVGVIQRHVRPHEVSVNRAGRAVVWGSDSVHGEGQIHAFRQDRIVAVKESKRPTVFTPHPAVTQHLRSYAYGTRPSQTPTPGDARSWTPPTRPDQPTATTTVLPIALRTRAAQTLRLPGRYPIPPVPTRRK